MINCVLFGEYHVLPDVRVVLAGPSPKPEYESEGWHRIAATDSNPETAKILLGLCLPSNVFNGREQSCGCCQRAIMWHEAAGARLSPVVKAMSGQIDVAGFTRRSISTGATDATR